MINKDNLEVGDSIRVMVNGSVDTVTVTKTGERGVNAFYFTGYEKKEGFCEYDEILAKVIPGNRQLSDGSWIPFHRVVIETFWPGHKYKNIEEIPPQNS